MEERGENVAIKEKCAAAIDLAKASVVNLRLYFQGSFL